LSVVFWHWEHFFRIPGKELTPFRRELEPLYFLFKPLYTDGYRAVELFFCLSGFIFFWLYSDRISNRTVSFKDFAVLRFSRLYPLHFLTLLFVAGAQLFLLRLSNRFFIYQNNDLYHFGLQLFFASNWGFERGDSFNGPVWSVSIEILLYGVFFFVSFVKFRRWWQMVLLVCGGYVLMMFGPLLIGEGLFSFFIGGLCFRVFSYISKRSPSGIALGVLGGFAVVMWVVVPLNTSPHLLYDLYRRFLWTEGLKWHGKDVLGAVLLMMPSVPYELLLFPLTIVTLALIEAQRGTLGKRLAFLGDISYSCYLLHFPLQLVFAAVAIAWSVPVAFFCTPNSLFLYFVILIPISLCSHHFIERPCQALLRAWLMPSVAVKSTG
jgi:peptidoglycan/LPS O-acetylase OafA/YrhL